MGTKDDIGGGIINAAKWARQQEKAGAKRVKDGPNYVRLGGADTGKTPRQKLDLLAEQADDLPEPARTMFLEVILEGQGHILAGGSPDDVMMRILKFADSADMGIK